MIISSLSPAVVRVSLEDAIFLQLLGKKGYGHFTGTPEPSRMKRPCNTKLFKGNVKTVCGGLDQGAKKVFFLEKEGNQVYDNRSGQKDFAV